MEEFDVQSIDTNQLNFEKQFEPNTHIIGLEYIRLIYFKNQFFLLLNKYTFVDFFNY